jgi:hypothetical protein
MMGVVPPQHLPLPIPSYPAVCRRRCSHNWDGPWPVFPNISLTTWFLLRKHPTSLGPGCKQNPILFRSSHGSINYTLYTLPNLLWPLHLCTTSTLKSPWGNYNLLGTTIIILPLSYLYYSCHISIPSTLKTYEAINFLGTGPNISNYFSLAHTSPPTLVLIYVY